MTDINGLIDDGVNVAGSAIDAAVPEAAPIVAEAEPIVAKVLSKDGTKLFEGLIKDAEQFVRDHFPRWHTAEAGPDYKVKVPEGVTFNHPDTAPHPDTVEN